jgi:flagella basal body P-ring formation protein FlgA
MSRADSLVALRTLPAQTVVTEADVTLVEAKIDGALTAVSPAVGLEVKTTVYAGRPLRPENLGPPALINRNQNVTLVYVSGGLTIVADGRALARGAEGEVIRAMNLTSKTTVSGRVDGRGRLIVGDSD